MLDDRVRQVLARLEDEDRREREEGVARGLRSRAVAPTTGQFLFALVAPQTDCEVLEIGGSRGYSTVWLAAGVRYLAQELGPKGIRVNGISAGPIKTLAAAGIGGFGKILKAVEENAPLRRNVTINDVGNAAAFLMSDLAAGITGEITYVDAGFNTTIGGM